MDRIIETPEPSIGLLIATYGAPAHIALQLESHRRLYASIPVMVHEDSSEQKDAVAAVCAEYGVPYLCTETRQGHQEGDLTAILRGVEFCHAQGLDICVKMSRTYIPITNWVPSLQQVAYETQYSSYSNICEGCNYGFRTECVGLHVPTFVNGTGVQRIKTGIERRSGWFNFVEAYLHKVVREVTKESACEFNRDFISKEGREFGQDSFAFWPWMHRNCRVRNPGMLWHRSDSPIDYYRLSLIYGLPYKYEDFVIQHF